MIKFISTFFLFVTVLLSSLQAQDDNLLDMLGEDESTNKVTNAFKSPRVINNHSMEMLPFGALDFRILHRFGRINQGASELFGLDNASMRMGFDYSFLKNLTVGVGRSTYKKELDGYIKYRILWQSEGKKEMPLSLIWISGMTINGLKNPIIAADTVVDETFAQRIVYSHQIIIGRKFSEKFTLQLSPTLLHQNYVLQSIYPHNVFALGIGSRYKLSNRIAVVLDYSLPFNRFPAKYYAHPLSVGVDIETGGHVFQLHVSNSAGMNERAFILEENGDWFTGDIQFGFNLSRVFQLQKQKVKLID